MVVTAKDGDVVLIRDGYHPVVAGPGYDVYYLNFISGKVRSLSNSSVSHKLSALTNSSYWRVKT